ncbi:tol-pal system protein YbgF [Methylocystis sp. B8]|uniref:tol-pal system protein YbgF n=1 Tax=Methylocystis sp. B8 TaxID=544938 RepID=UPI0010FF2159|nr:tol-pal system protein YbgF [Methylocystis sp. B8]TLG71623.1 tol-pal system protein YbgF [Methylocystis sp. B8]
MLSRSVYIFALSFLMAGAAQAFEVYGDPRPESNIRLAQTYSAPPSDIYDAPDAGPGSDGALALRIDRLERELRRLTGQNEELQHKVQLLEEQLRAAKQEPLRTETGPRAPAAPTDVTQVPPAAPAMNQSAGKRSDAFDPAAQPSAPGAPRPLGTTPPSAPLDATARASGSVTPAPVREAGQPLDIAHGRLVGDQPAPAEIAAAPAMPGPKEEYDQAVSALRTGKYEEAEKSLTTFLAKNGKGKLAPAATFNLGESFFLRGRHREAAEKYLEISTKYGDSPQAPEALLRLGQSLSAMGAKEQACASYSEINVKFPKAATRIREAAQRESKKIQC